MLKAITTSTDAHKVSLPHITHLQSLSPVIAALEVQISIAQKYKSELARISALCQEMGYADFQAFSEAYLAFLRTQHQHQHASISTVRRAGLRGTGKHATQADMVVGQRMQAEGYSLADISRATELSYQTAAKHMKRGWTLHRKVKLSSTRWQLSNQQWSHLSAQAKARLQPLRAFIAQQLTTLGDSGIATFTPQDTESRFQRHIWLSPDILATMDALVAKGITPSRQQILDACIGKPPQVALS